MGLKHKSKLQQVGLMVLLLFVTFSGIKAQENKLKIMDKCVDYVNKSIDGGFIIHRLLENYNKDVNKYVDLDTFKLNFYTNKDLPKDLYASTWFYDPTPAVLYKEIVASSYYRNNADVKNIIDRIQYINDRLNALRYNIEENINNLDLTKRENLGTIYKQLEEGVELYDSFYKNSLQLKNTICDMQKDMNIEPEFPAFRKKIDALYNANFSMMKAIRAESDASIQSVLKEQKAALAALSINDLRNLNSLRYNDREVQRLYAQILERSREISAIGDAILSGGNIPKEVSQYGKYYYYYNYRGLSKLNEQGPGMIADLNRMNILAMAELPLKNELPYFFKVIYPKKIEKIELVEPTHTIVALPKTIENRAVKIADHKIRTGNKKMTIEIYDHMIEDGDIVSLQFNDEWVLKNHPLKKKKYKLELTLNTTGKNYLLLHAENEGSRPPNTMAVDYDYFGSKKRFILESDMNTSELIEIVYID